MNLDEIRVCYFWKRFKEVIVIFSVAHQVDRNHRFN